MAQLPGSIRAFRDHIRPMSMKDLHKHPKFMDLSSKERWAKTSITKADTKLSHELHESYPLVQSGFFHFSGHCQMHCPMDQQHIHGIQTPGVLRVKGIPGVCIYPRAFVPVLPEFLDAMMQLEPVAEEKGMEYVLHTANEVAKCAQVVPPDELSGVIRTAFPSYFRIHNAESATLSVSTPERMVGMRQPNSNRGIVAHVSLGCDAVIVLGTEKPEYDDGDLVEPAQDEVVFANDSWQDLVDLDGKADEHPVRAPIHDNKRASPVPKASPLALAAIQLRAGDALIFGNRACATWYGLAKVLDSSSQLDHQWPYLREDSRDSGTRGQLNGKTVEIEFQ
ncbi:hypothetical protein PRZ48_012205 [Zasmidium cellare]|uniref:Uncharacterized protein n=1 Tax=Zasmidium cellare TaxID=395010 RepID=A0ABR0E4P1_ZASCE|nr:hypothetical protein PRZ48_012205 [Zasmidium cellare]